jgi:hypothetical protein
MTFKSNALTPMWISCQLQETDSTVTELSGSGRSTDGRPLMEHGRNLLPVWFVSLPTTSVLVRNLLFCPAGCGKLPDHGCKMQEHARD